MRCKPKSARRFSLSVALAVGVALAWAAGAPLLAQPPRNPQPRNPERNPIEAQVFPPDLVMRFQTEIGLSAEQRQQIIAEVQQMEADMVPLRFEMGETTQRLAKLLSASKVDEEQALALVDRVTELEGQIKKRHLRLVVRTKNLLTPEQQTRLKELRGEGRR